MTTPTHDPIREGVSATRPFPRWYAESEGGIATTLLRGFETALRALGPDRYWRAIPLRSPLSLRGLAMLVVASAVMLHLAAASARVAASVIAPVPAATMGPLHRAAEVALAVVAPASRFSGAELWNVSRNAGRREERGRDAVVAFAGGVARLAIAPWTESIAIEPHPAAERAMPRVELTPSLAPLASPLGWLVITLGGPASALLVLAIPRTTSRIPTSREILVRAVACSSPVAIALGVVLFGAQLMGAAGVVSGRALGLAAALGTSGIIVVWTRALDGALARLSDGPRGDASAARRPRSS